MLRPEVLEKLECPSVGMATSWTIGRKSVPFDNLEEARSLFKRNNWPFAKGKIAKSNSKAVSLREQANAAYKKDPNDTTKALQLYNQSICMAEEGSADLGLGYANRSAVYFNRKQYRECLHNIELARQHNYPAEMMSKLGDREQRVRQQLLEKDISDYVEENIPTRHCSIKSCLEVGEGGQGIRTNRSLEEGEKVLLEKPFVLVVEAELAYQRCDYCGSSNEYNLRPCKGCTAVMYCSEECQDQSFQRYHQFECEIVDDLQLLFRGPKATRMFHVTLRLFWHVVLLFLEDPIEFLRRVETPVELEKYCDPFALEPSDYVLHLLATCRDSEHNTDDIQERTGKCVSQVMAILMYVIAVEENESLWSRLNEADGSKKLPFLLFRLVQWTDRLMDHEIEGVTCFYPFTRLLRHSSTPNAKQSVEEPLQSVVVLTCPVVQGQEITTIGKE
uniref:MYND-type domain-containing protein n=1 Tax=Anopheles christyi TaxID=43041 RepID=A0A182K6X0_9DIPT